MPTGLRARSLCKDEGIAVRAVDFVDDIAAVVGHADGLAHRWNRFANSAWFDTPGSSGPRPSTARPRL